MTKDKQGFLLVKPIIFVSIDAYRTSNFMMDKGKSFNSHNKRHPIRSNLFIYPYIIQAKQYLI